jgi:GNAT superfamily N-acetyltransferase
MTPSEDLLGRGVVRKLWTTDRTRFAEHLARLDPASRARRFHGLVSDAYVASYAEGALRFDTVLYGYFDAGVLRAAAELHPLGRSFTGAGAAEAAYSVEAAYQDQGVGTELFRRLTVAARNRGIRRILHHFTLDNAAMRRLCERFEATITVEAGEATAVMASAPPTALSLWSEAVADGTGLAKSILDAELKLVRAA